MFNLQIESYHLVLAGALKPQNKLTLQNRKLNSCKCFEIKILKHSRNVLKCMSWKPVKLVKTSILIKKMYNSEKKKKRNLKLKEEFGKPLLFTNAD